MIRFIAVVLTAFLFVAGAHAQPANGGAGFSVTPPPGVPTTGPLATQFVFPENYGALGNGIKTFDGAVTGAGTVAAANNSGTTLTAPAVTTVNANDYVVSIFANGVAFAVAPSGYTLRNNVAFSSTGQYGLAIGDNLQASPGASTAITSTLNAATASSAATIALVPAPASSISYVNSQTYAHNNTSKPAITFTGVNPSAGDYLIACFSYGQITGHIVNLLPANTSGWSMITTSSGLTPVLICLGRFATASEPSTYYFNLNTGNLTGIAGMMVAYRGTSGVEAMNQTLTSATANFQAGMVGYPICVAGEMGYNNNSLTNGAFTSPQQVCGTITAVNSATSIQTSMYLPKTQTNLPIAFGHDDTAAFTTMLSTAPCSTIGCGIQLGMKHYIITGGLTFPQNQAINMQGAGGAVPNTTNNLKGGGGDPLANYTGGSTITMLAQKNNTAAITIGNASAANTSTTTSMKLGNFALVGGVGNYSDGGGYNSATQLGTDGIDVFSYQLLELSHVIIVNFAGNGLYIDGTSGQNGPSFNENISFLNGYIGMNGLSGMLVGSSAITINTEPISMRESIIEGNGFAGVTFAGTTTFGFWFAGNTQQWDCTMQPTVARQYELDVPGHIFGGMLEGNYFETDANYGSYCQKLVSSTPGASGLQFGPNFYVGTGMAWAYNGLPAPIYSAAGTAIGSPTTVTAGTKALVSDSTACTPGTTYVSGGATQCLLLSNGANWIETGASYP